MIVKNKPKNRWFAERRDLFFKKMVQEFHETLTCYLSLYEQYLAEHTILFDDFEKLVGSEAEKGLLWLLKDRCHQLWRDEDPKQDLNGCLFDWVVGSIFHEAMKLKENIYMHQYYRPLAEEMRDRLSSSTVRFCGVECKQFTQRTAFEINRQMENLGFMFGRANYLLRTLMPNETENSILLRFLVENEAIVQGLWSEKVNDVFADMFGSVVEGYCAAARSYNAGQWYEKALKTYKKALCENKNCAEAQKFIAQYDSFLEKPRRNNATIS